MFSVLQRLSLMRFGDPAARESKVEPASMQRFGRRRIELALTSSTLLLLILSLMSEAAHTPRVWILGIDVAAYITGGWFGFQDALRRLGRGRLDVNFLMIIAALGAAMVDQWHEGTMLLFLFSLSNTLQDYAMERTRNAIASLLKLRPSEAAVLRGNVEERVPVSALQVGDLMLIRPGEMLPTDGVIQKGRSALNQASITGESMPVEKGPGEKVFAGSLNGGGALEVEVTHLEQESTLSRIIQLVETAQSEKAQTQRRLERFEVYYTWAVLSAVLLLIFVPWIGLGRELQPTFYRAMVLLVVASPCALVISTPASILSAIANGARRGILFKGGAHLENLARVSVAAFDKTGTLTQGKLSVTDIALTRPSPAGFNADSLLGLAAALESRSEHPIAQAILSAAQERGVRLPELTQFEALAGRGIRAAADGYLVWMGGARMFEAHGEIVPPELLAARDRLEREGKTVLILHRELGREANIGRHEAAGGGWLGAIAVTDSIRPEARAAIARLKAAGVRRTVMLTGDNKAVAAAIAAQIGVDDFYAALLPEDKVTIVKRLEAQYGAVLMVGDGVNDAPALAQARVGAAMGAIGCDVALETADVVLMSDDLSKIPYAVRLSQRAQRIVGQNLAFSLLVILCLILALFGVFGFALHLPLGVVMHEGSTLVVVANGLRLLAVYPESIALAR